MGLPEWIKQWLDQEGLAEQENPVAEERVDIEISSQDLEEYFSSRLSCQSVHLNCPCFSCTEARLRERLSDIRIHRAITNEPRDSIGE